MRENYGDIFTARVVNGTIVCVGDPAGAQAIFSADPDTFIPFAPEALIPFVGRNSMLYLSGQRHRRERKLLMPAFHGDRMRAYGAAIRESALAAASRWIPGKEMAFQETSQLISLDVIIRTVFGVQTPEHVEQARKVIIHFVDSTSPSLLFFPFLQLPFFGHSPWDRFRRAKEELSVVIYAEIEKRRRSGASGADILSLMLAARHEDGSAMTDEELRDELLTLLFAGHETTGIALAWAVYWLLRNPDCMTRLLAEIDALGKNPEPEQIVRLPYLDAVVSETLRLHPIVPDVPRKLTRPFEINGYVLPAGIGIAVATAMLHTRPDLYPNPEQFKPERFLERKYSPFEFTPFGGGARRCLGAAFATYEMKIVLATLLSHHRLVLAETAEVRPGRRNVVLGPATGVHVKLIGPRSAPSPVMQAIAS